MLTYIQIHLYLVIPPILLLGAIYGPLIGRREILKILWLGLMATIWTTPWDNFILSHSGWSYPPGSILGKIFYVPIEEHMFFILQPILIILLHCIITHGRLIPFDIDLLSSTSDLTGERAGNGYKQDGPILHSTIENEVSVLGGTGSGDQNRVAKGKKGSTIANVQTLPRRPLAASRWLLSTIIGLILVLEAHGHIGLSSIAGPAFGMGRHAFYQGWILFWISPVIGFLTYLGGRLTKEDKVALVFGTGYFWIVDTVALRSGSWSILTETTFGLEIWRGLPVEEAMFFFLTSYLIILSISLISHLHTLLLLCPKLPPCPPSNPLRHIKLLAEVAFSPPLIDRRMLHALIEGEKTLRKGSKSFDVAKLAFGREMRLGLVVIYAWCRVTDNLIDEPYVDSPSDHGSQKASLTPSTEGDTLNTARARTLAAIRKHLVEVYNSQNTNSNTDHNKTDTDTEPDNGNHRYPAHTYQTNLDRILDDIPHLVLSDRSAFHLFASIIPRLVPIYPFQELCDGYETDLQFPSDYVPFDQATSATSDTSASPSSPRASAALREGERPQPFDLTEFLPIRTTEDLLKYADDVAGSIASAICYLAWSVLDNKSNDRHDCIHDQAIKRSIARPVEGYTFAKSLHDKTGSIRAPDLGSELDAGLRSRLAVIRSAREMGRALQLVNISRDVAKDALISRVYVPLSLFPSAAALLSILYPTQPPSNRVPSYAPYTLRLLDLADQMRLNSAGAIEHLPRTARAGIRAMVASYFEIAVAVRTQHGEVDENGVRVSKKRRIRKAMGAIWLGGGGDGGTNSDTGI
ncbi:hypothetical protein IAT40_006782 [Kwoniella sp. CBS 6097]